MDNRKLNIAAAVLLAIGLAQMTGDLAGIAALKGLGAATMISPAPKVFTAHKGHETYSAKYVLEWTDTTGTAKNLTITPELYARVLGPYQRRNVYGAVLSYGPVMSTDPASKPMFDQVSRFALCGQAPLLREVGVDPSTVSGNISVRFIPRAEVDMGNLPRLLEVSCK